MRPVALGRRNWIHVGSKYAGPKVAAIVSVVETCRRLKIPARECLAGSCRPSRTFPSCGSPASPLPHGPPCRGGLTAGVKVPFLLRIQNNCYGGKQKSRSCGLAGS